MTFKIKNLSAYRKAKYPSYTEPDKLDLSRYSFPFAKTAKLGAIATVLASGFIAANCEAQNSQNGNPPNPQRWDYVFGRQVITKEAIPENEVLPIIFKALSEAGYNMKKNIPYKENKVEFELDLYDLNKKVGFEYISDSDWEDGINSSPTKLSYNEYTLMLSNKDRKKTNIILIDGRNFSYRQYEQNAKKKALLRLEEAVRQYIKQLKEQGGL